MIPLKDWLEALPEDDPMRRPARIGYLRARPPIRCCIGKRIHWLWAAFQRTAVVSNRLAGDRKTVLIERVLIDPENVGLVFHLEGSVGWHPGTRYKAKGKGRPKDYAVPDVGATR